MEYLADFPKNEEEIMRVVAKNMREHTQCRVCWHDVELRFCTEKSSVYEAEFFHEPDEVDGFYWINNREKHELKILKKH